MQEQGQLATLSVSGANAQAVGDTYANASAIRNNVDISAFFEHIMVPDPVWMSGVGMEPPLDLTTWMPDMDWHGDDDIFGSDFAPTLDQTFESHMSYQNISPVQGNNDTGIAAVASQFDGVDDDARRRHIAFQRSPWYRSHHEYISFSRH